MRRLATAVAGLALLWGCPRQPFHAPPPAQDKSLRGESKAEAASSATPFVGAELELQRIEYDGKELKGRLLVGAKEKPLRLDKRLSDEVSVDVIRVLSCRTGEPLEFLMADFFPGPPRDGDMLNLEPGKWYGAEVRFPLFDEHFTGQLGPECIDVELAVFLVEPDAVVRLRVQAKTEAFAQSDAGLPWVDQDAGVPGPPQDAGVP